RHRPIDAGHGVMEPRMVLAANASAMTLDGTRTYIVGRKRAVVIDPGPDDPAHLDAVVGQLEEAERVDIVVTHHHRDHAGGAVALASRLAGRLGSASQ